MARFDVPIIAQSGLVISSSDKSCCQKLNFSCKHEPDPYFCLCLLLYSSYKKYTKSNICFGPFCWYYIELASRLLGASQLYSKSRLSERIEMLGIESDLCHGSYGNAEGESHLHDVGRILLVPSLDARSATDQDEKKSANEFSDEHAPDIAVLGELLAAEYVAHFLAKCHEATNFRSDLGGSKATTDSLCVRRPHKLPLTNVTTGRDPLQSAAT